MESHSVATDYRTFLDFLMLTSSCATRISVSPVDISTCSVPEERSCTRFHPTSDKERLRYTYIVAAMIRFVSVFGRLARISLHLRRTSIPSNRRPPKECKFILKSCGTPSSVRRPHPWAVSQVTSTLNHPTPNIDWNPA